MRQQHSLPHSPCHTIKSVLRASAVLFVDMGVQGYGRGRAPSPQERPARPGCRGTLAWGTRAASVGVAPLRSRAVPRTLGIAPWQRVRLSLTPPGLTLLPETSWSRPAGQDAAGVAAWAAPHGRAPSLPRAPPPHFRRRPAPPRPWGAEAAAEAAAPARPGRPPAAHGLGGRGTWSGARPAEPRVRGAAVGPGEVRVGPGRAPVRPLPQ